MQINNLIKPKCLSCKRKSNKLCKNQHYVCEACSEIIQTKLGSPRNFSFNRGRTYEKTVNFVATIKQVHDNVVVFELDGVNKIKLLQELQLFVRQSKIHEPYAVSCVFLSNTTIAATMSKDMYIIDSNYDELAWDSDHIKSPARVTVASKIYMVGPVARCFIMLGVGAIKTNDDY